MPETVLRTEKYTWRRSLKGKSFVKILRDETKIKSLIDLWSGRRSRQERSL
ncbi:hypothetical protein SAMD00079811_76980 (plasmid) [Scytonema sp. HK-05]|nr:hypothetical protein SAMD00079811_76980 [Scytonema sp. HK-05]